MLQVLPAAIALQGGFADIFTNPATAWIIVPMLIFGIPIVQALVSPFKNKLKADERERMRKMYERIVMEKLDVIKTAAAMGYRHDELNELDQRLEQVIGAEEMKALLDGRTGSSGNSKGVKIIVENEKMHSGEALRDAMRDAGIEDDEESGSKKSKSRATVQ